MPSLIFLRSSASVRSSSLNPTCEISQFAHFDFSSSFSCWKTTFPRVWCLYSSRTVCGSFQFCAFVVVFVSPKNNFDAVHVLLPMIVVFELCCFDQRRWLSFLSFLGVVDVVIVVDFIVGFDVDLIIINQSIRRNIYTVVNLLLLLLVKTDADFSHLYSKIYWRYWWIIIKICLLMMKCKKWE